VPWALGREGSVHTKRKRTTTRAEAGARPRAATYHQLRHDGRLQATGVGAGETKQHTAAEKEQERGKAWDGQELHGRGTKQGCGTIHGCGTNKDVGQYTDTRVWDNTRVWHKTKCGTIHERGTKQGCGTIHGHKGVGQKLGCGTIYGYKGVGQFTETRVWDNTRVWHTIRCGTKHGRGTKQRCGTIHGHKGEGQYSSVGTNSGVGQNKGMRHYTGDETA
jgi:hypothetical protein